MIMKNIAVFASGEGTNTQHIIDYFKDSKTVKVALVVSNNLSAKVIQKAQKSDIPNMVSDKKFFFESEIIVNELKNFNIDFIVLAGFLWKISDSIIKAFTNKIINIHPALLPKFGGKGMYGMNVHKAVIEAKEKESGITIHYVNEKYDEGKIISQHHCIVSEIETADSLAKKIHQLEYEYYPQAIEKIITSL